MPRDMGSLASGGESARQRPGLIALRGARVVISTPDKMRKRQARSAPFPRDKATRVLHASVWMLVLPALAAIGRSHQCDRVALMTAIVKGFRMPASHWARGCTEAGVRKASKEETAGGVCAGAVSVYGDLRRGSARLGRSRTELPA